jgi:hypothetical protein
MYRPHEEVFDARLEALINKAFKNQWAIDSEIDWKLDPVLPTGIDRTMYIDMVSQLYYSEEATIALLGRMLRDVPDLQAKRYLCTQAADESRHAQAYRAYLERLGDIAPINEGLKAIFDAGLSWSGEPCGMIVALNICLEGEALKQQHKRIETLPCPLFKQVNEAIVVDEARHSAFGQIYLKTHLSTITDDAKRAILLWIGSLWQLWSQANEGRYKPDPTNPAAAVLQTPPEELEQRWVERAKVFEDIGLPLSLLAQ